MTRRAQLDPDTLAILVAEIDARLRKLDAMLKEAVKPESPYDTPCRMALMDLHYWGKEARGYVRDQRRSVSAYRAAKRKASK